MRKSLGISLFAVLLTLTAQAQLTGIDLFNAMNEPGFIEYEGQSGLPWLPGDMGYLEIKPENGGVEYYKVDPESGEESLLFDARTRRAIIDQYNDISGSDVSSYPFEEFEFVMDDQAIFFEIEGIDYVFELDETHLRK